MYLRRIQHEGHINLRTVKYFRYSSRTPRMYQNQIYITNTDDRANKEMKKIISFNF